MKPLTHIPDNGRPRIIIAGGGFAGLKLAKKLAKSDYQIVLLDKNNYHQFQPLLYQVATAGLEPSSISFPLRKIFQKMPNVHFRMAELERVDLETREVVTSRGRLRYDYLVLAMGAGTNFFGNQHLRDLGLPMKSVPEAIHLRNAILSNFEDAINESDPERVRRLLNIVIVGGGPTGVELAGALAEMKRYILPKDYPELDFSQMQIQLLEGGSRVLNGFTGHASKYSGEYLERLGVQVRLNTLVKDFNGHEVQLADGQTLPTETVIWAAGITGNTVDGLPAEALGRGQRLQVDGYNRLRGHDNVFVIGDLALMTADEGYPEGHPQVAQVAMQQASLLARNLRRLKAEKELKPFRYRDLGSMATVGRNLAVADLPGVRLRGFVAWMLWLFVHLMQILGVKNRFLIFINWMWSYVTYDLSLRLLFKHQQRLERRPELEEVS